eukprot:TRINITY_DN66622_c13_g1_i1.p1 TRINITY_DN66622_c13_g1~~TRINITY_DN66622_c13_g1_i1.p1  ORF type:complete len:381 (+),score=58.97 TRINITY_DN66622_c13_g1_i1:69-1145(+)
MSNKQEQSEDHTGSNTQENASSPQQQQQSPAYAQQAAAYATAYSSTGFYDGFGQSPYPTYPSQYHYGGYGRPPFPITTPQAQAQLMAQMLRNSGRGRGGGRRQQQPEPEVDEDFPALAAKLQANPDPLPEFTKNPEQGRFFVIKSFTKADVVKAMQEGVWASTKKGMENLDKAWTESSEDGIYLLFSVNGSGAFCGVAKMTSPIDNNQDVKWCGTARFKGHFKISWIFIVEIGNQAFRDLLNKDSMSVTRSRDTYELSLSTGLKMLNTFRQYQSSPDRERPSPPQRQQQQQQQQQPPQPPSSYPMYSQAAYSAYGRGMAGYPPWSSGYGFYGPSYGYYGAYGPYAAAQQQHQQQQAPQ